jgi:hypothetical protein
MSTANLDAADLAAVAVDGLINEDVMQNIWDISSIPLPLTDRIGSSTIGNARFSWTKDKLQDVEIDGQKVDGADTNTDNDTNTGSRVQNFAEIDTKTVQVSSRARESDGIGFTDALSYQVMMRQRELRRDVEAISLSNNASQADDGNTTPGMTGGLNAWIETNIAVGALGAAGGFNTVTGIVDAYTPGTAAAMSEGTFKDLMQSVYQQGGESMIVMATPAVVRRFSEYQFTAGARVATLTRDSATEPGGREKGTSLGAVNVYIGDFATVEIVANRLQQPIAADVSTMFILDMALIEHAFLKGYVVEPLDKTGLADKRQMRVDWGLRVGNEEGLAAYCDIDETADMVA